MSKGMDALRRSKASAGEAPNLPPHRGLLSRPLTNVQFNLIAVTERQSLRGAPRGRVGDYGAAHLAVRSPVLPYGGFYGGEAQRGVPGAVTYYVPAQRIDDLLVVHLEDSSMLRSSLRMRSTTMEVAPMLMVSPWPVHDRRLDLAVAVAFEIDGHGPPALGASPRHDDVGTLREPPCGGGSRSARRATQCGSCGPGCAPTFP